METTRFAVGPRGTERQALTTSSGTDVSYPLYDAHGNAFASIRRDTNNPGGYVPLTTSDVRAFDPWGNGIVSTGSHTGFGMPESGKPVQAYCGSLGHRKDDETGLIYMRARYYDPQVGRFTSEDPARDGVNWFVYCANNPVNFSDPQGKFALTDAMVGAIIGALYGAASSVTSQVLEGGWGAISVQEVMGAAWLGAAAGGGFALAGAGYATGTSNFGKGSSAAGAVSASMGRDMQVAFMLMVMDYD